MDRFGNLLSVLGDAEAARLLLLGFSVALLSGLAVFVIIRRVSRAMARTPAAEISLPAMTRGTWAARINRKEHLGSQSETLVGGGSDPEWRVQAVAAHNYRQHPVFSRSQLRLLPVLEKITYTRGRGHRLLAHAALSRLVAPVATPSTTPDRLSRAERALDGLHLDFPLIDAEGMLVAAIELRAPRPLKAGAADDSEAIKREVLRKAGIPLIELRPTDSEDAIRAVLEPILSGRPGAASA